MRDAGLGVELVLAIDAALDLARTDGGDDGRHTRQEIVLRLFAFQAGIETLRDLFQAFRESPFRPHRDLVAHQDAEAIDRLPLFTQCEQRADLEVARRNVDGLRVFAPLREVGAHFPIRVAVIDDEDSCGALFRLRRRGGHARVAIASQGFQQRAMAGSARERPLRNLRKR